MSSIPNSAMPHAKVKHDDDAAPAPAAKGDWMDDATDAAKAGIATATDAAPALRVKDAPEKKTPPKPAPKKAGKPKKAH